MSILPQQKGWEIPGGWGGGPEDGKGRGGGKKTKKLEGKNEAKLECSEGYMYIWKKS